MTLSSANEPSIVVVDDDADHLLLTCRLLRQTGLPHRVDTFTCSVTALRHLEAAVARASDRARMEPPIAIVDGNMPQLDGFSLIQAIRALPGRPASRLIMLSGSAVPGDRSRALRCGADEYLEKFPDAETLRRAIVNRESEDGN